MMSSVVSGSFFIMRCSEVYVRHLFFRKSYMDMLTSSLSRDEPVGSIISARTLPMPRSLVSMILNTAVISAVSVGFCTMILALLFSMDANGMLDPPPPGGVVSPGGGSGSSPEPGRPAEEDEKSVKGVPEVVLRMNVFVDVNVNPAAVKGPCAW